MRYHLKMWEMTGKLKRIFGLKNSSLLQNIIILLFIILNLVYVSSKIISCEPQIKFVISQTIFKDF